jgi:hypothetical protein
MSEPTPPMNDGPTSFPPDPEVSELVPPIEAIIGHWLALGEVNIVFREHDGRQFYLVMPTLERSYGTFLAPGQTWGRRDESRALKGIPRERAFHEAGHALAAIDEGIKVEYVTILPHTGWDGERRLGYCQYDYHLPTNLKQDCSAWAENAAKAMLGGPLADYMFRERNGLGIPDSVQDAWQYDRNKAMRLLADKARKEGSERDLDQEFGRLFDALSKRFQEPWAWEAISRIAARLCEEGAISGQAAKEIIDNAGGRTMVSKEISEAASRLTTAILNPLNLPREDNVRLGAEIERELKRFAEVIIEATQRQELSASGQPAAAPPAKG